MVGLAQVPVGGVQQPQIQHADILAVRGTRLLAKGILAATGNTVSHVGLVISGDPPLVIEALTRVKTNPLDVSIKDAEAAYLLKPLNLTADQRRTIVYAACALSADGYGYLDIGLQGMDALLHSRKPTDLLAGALGIKKHPICSYLVAASYERAGLNFGVNDKSITPADIFQFAKSNPAIYSVVRLK